MYLGTTRVYIITIRIGAHIRRPLYVCEHGDRGDVQESYYPTTASVGTYIVRYNILLNTVCSVCVVRAKSSTGFVIERRA